MVSSDPGIRAFVDLTQEKAFVEPERFKMSMWTVAIAV